jgi:RNA polymerase sigma-70 factor (ECF subfamily)
MQDDFLDLLERLSRGDEAAAEQVVAAYQPYLRLVIRRYFPARIRSKFDSADVVQSVWVHVLNGLRAGAWHFPDRAHLQAFLAKVARRRLVSRCRHHNTALEREQSGAPDLDALPGRGEPQPCEVVQADELWEKMLELCPASHRDVLRLRRQGLQMEEIARRTGLHEGSVRRILRRIARELALEREPLAASTA